MNRYFRTSYHMPILFFTQLMGLAFGMEPLPPQTIVDGTIMDQGAVSEGVRNLWSRLKLKSKDVAIAIAVVALVIVPFESVAVPLLYLLQGERNTLLIQIVPFLGNAFSICAADQCQYVCRYPDSTTGAPVDLACPTGMECGPDPTGRLLDTVHVCRTAE